MSYAPAEMPRTPGFLKPAERLGIWWARAYVPWARRHEPYPFAVSPLILIAAFFIYWAILGTTVALILFGACVLAVATFATWAWLYIRRRRRARLG